jgi:hypothetical protein
VQVVANFGRGRSEPRDRKEQLAVGRGFDVVIEWIVLEQHRWHVAAEKLDAKVAVLHAQPPDGYGKIGLLCQVDF